LPRNILELISSLTALSIIQPFLICFKLKSYENYSKNWKFKYKFKIFGRWI
jgi:hypothetical protein